MDSDGGGSVSVRRGDRWALRVFVVVVVASLPILFHAARDQWFFLDEWDFVAARDLASFDDLFRPHNEHWTTTGVVTYRLIFQVVGARTYWPYLVPVITAHLTAAALLRVVMRAGADAWIATAACSVFVLFGAGRENILWGFQIGFAGSLALGLAALVLASRTGPLGWRDVGAAAAAVGSVASAGTGVAMVGMVALACLLRRDVVRAALLTAVPGAAVVAWYVAYGSDAPWEPRPAAAEGASFAGWVLVDTLEGLGRPTAVAVLLALAAVVGTAVAIASVRHRSAAPGAPDDRRWAARADVFACSVGALVLAAGTAVTRASALPGGRGGVPLRYVHLVAAAVLPAIVLGLTWAVARVAPEGRRRVVGVALAATVLLVGLPGNVHDLEPRGALIYTLGDAERMRADAAVAVAQRTPPDLEIDPFAAPGLTAGWLRQAWRAGDLPGTGEPVAPDPLARASITQSFEQIAPVPANGCRPLTGPTDPAAGDVLAVRTAPLSVVAPVDATMASVFLLGAESVLGRYDVPVTVRAVRSLRITDARAGDGSAAAVCRAG